MSRKYTYYTFTNRDPIIDETWALVSDRLETMSKANGKSRGHIKKFAEEANMSASTLYNYKNRKTRRTYYSTVANLWAACGHSRIPISAKARKDK